MGPRSRICAVVAVLLAPVVIFLVSLALAIPHVTMKLTKVHLDASDAREHARLSVTANVAGDEGATHGFSVTGGTCSFGGSSVRAHLVDLRRAGGTAELDVELEHGSFGEAVREISGFSAVSCRFILMIDVFRTGARVPFLYYYSPFGKSTGRLGEAARSSKSTSSPKAAEDSQDKSFPSVHIVKSPAAVTWPTSERKVLRYVASHMLEASFPPKYNSVIDHLMDVPITVKASVRYADEGDTGAFSAHAVVDCAVQKTRGSDGAVFAMPVSLVGHTDLAKAAAVLLGTYASGGEEGRHVRFPFEPTNRPQVLPIQATAPRSPLARGFGCRHTVSLEDERRPGSHGPVQFMRLGRRHLARRLGKAKSVAKAPEDLGFSMHTKLKFDEKVMARVDIAIAGGSPKLTADISVTMRFHNQEDMDKNRVNAHPHVWHDEGTAITVAMKAELDDKNPAAFVNTTFAMVSDWHGGEINDWQGGHNVVHATKNSPVNVKLDAGFDHALKMAEVKFRFCAKSTSNEKVVWMTKDQFSRLSKIPSSYLDWYYKSTLKFVVDPPPTRRLAEAIGRPAAGMVLEAARVANKTHATVQPAVHQMAATVGRMWKELGGRRLAACDDQCIMDLLSKQTLGTKKESMCIELDGLIDLDGDLAVTSDLDIGFNFKVEDILHAKGSLIGTKPAADKRKWVGSVGLQMFTTEREVEETYGQRGKGIFKMTEGMTASMLLDSDEATAGKYAMSGNAKMTTLCEVPAAEMSKYSAVLSSSFSASQPLCSCKPNVDGCSPSGSVVCCQQKGMMADMGMKAKDINADIWKEDMTLKMNRPFSIFSLALDGKVGNKITVMSTYPGGKETNTLKFFDDNQKEQLKVENTNTKNSKGGTESTFKLFDDKSKEVIAVDLSTEDQDKTVGASAKIKTEESTMNALLKVDTSDLRYGDMGLKVWAELFDQDSKGMGGWAEFDHRKTVYGDYGMRVRGELKGDNRKTTMEPELTINRKNADAQFVSLDVKLEEGDKLQGRLSYDSTNNGDLRKFKAQAEDKEGVILSGNVDLTKTSSAADGDEQWSHDSAVNFRNDDTKKVEKAAGVSGLYIKNVNGKEYTYSLVANLVDKDSKPQMGFTGSFLEVKEAKMKAQVKLTDDKSKPVIDSALTLEKKKSGTQETFTLNLDVQTDKPQGSLDGSFVKDPQKGVLKLTLKDDKSTPVIDLGGTMPKIGSFFDGEVKLRWGDELKEEQKFNLRMSDGFLKTSKFSISDYETFTMLTSLTVEKTDMSVGLQLETEPTDRWPSGAGLDYKLLEDKKLEVDLSVYADFRHNPPPALMAADPQGAAPTPTVTKATMVIDVDDPTKFDAAALKKEMAKLYGISENDISVENIEFRVKMGMEFTGTVTEQQAKNAMAIEFGVDSSKVEVTLTKKSRRRRLAGTTQVDATIVTTDATKAKQVKTKGTALSSDASSLQTKLAAQGASVTVQMTKMPAVQVKLGTTMKSNGKLKTPSSSQLNTLAKAAGGTGATMSNVQSNNVVETAGAVNSVPGALVWGLSLLALSRRMAA